MRHPLLYEINTRCWLAELSEHAGHRVTLGDVPDAEFDLWQRCGFTHIWLMGVWAPGARGRSWSQKHFRGREHEFGCADISGSPYAITGYSASRRLGGETAFAKFRRKLNARGMRLILDFIPNHTAIDHPWVKEHPEFYVRADAHVDGTMKPHRDAAKWFAYGHCGHGPPWMDTLQLDYRNPSLREMMIGELLAIAEKCDGVRCDMAMLALNDVFERTWQRFPSADPASHGSTDDFWSAAVAAVRKKRNDFLFVAEVYWDLEARLQELDFDFTYNKGLYDRIVARDARGVTECLQSRTPEFIARSAHFIENHDEPRIASLLSFEEHRAAALLILTLPGMRLLHEGQLAGARARAHIHFARRLMEETDARIAAFYQTLLDTLPRTAVGHGSWQLLAAQPAWADNPSHANFVLIQWQLTSDVFDLVVINLAATAGQCFAPLQIDGLARGHWRIGDFLGNEIHERSGTELAQRGLYLDLPPHGAQLFHCERMQ